MAVSLGLADEHDRRPCPVDRADVVVEERLHSQLVQDVVGNFAEMVRCQHLLVVGHRLVAGINVREERNEIRQQQEPQPDEIDRDRQHEHQPEHAGKEDGAVPDGELQIVEFLGVVFHPVRRPGPQQVDDHDRHELEEIQVHSRPARHVLASGPGCRNPKELGRLRRRGGDHGQSEKSQERQEQADTLLTFLGAMRLGGGRHHRMPCSGRVIPFSAIRSNSGLGAFSNADGPFNFLGDHELPQALGEVNHSLFLAQPDRLGQLDVFFVAGSAS